MDVDVAIARDPTFARAILDSLKQAMIDHGHAIFLFALPRVPTEEHVNTSYPSMLADAPSVGVENHVQLACATLIARRMGSATTERLKGGLTIS